MYRLFDEQKTTFSESCLIQTSATVRRTTGLISDIIKNESKNYGNKGKVIVFADVKRELIDCLLNDAEENACPEIEHFVFFDENSKNLNKEKNLRRIESLVRVGLCVRNYRVKFCESNNLTGKFEHRIMPYFVVSSDAVVVMSADYKNSFVSYDKEWVETYRSVYSNLSVKGKELFSCRKMDDLLAHIGLMGKSLCYLQYQPEMIRYTDSQDVGKLLKKNIRNRDNVMLNLERYKSSFTHTYSLFTRKGLYDFCEKGVVSGFQHFFHSPSPEQRVKILKKMRTDISIHKFKQKNLMVKDTFFSVPEDMCVLFSEGKTLSVDYICENGKCFLTLNKIDDFDCIIKSLDCDTTCTNLEKAVESTEELLRTINELIEKYQG